MTSAVNAPVCDKWLLPILRDLLPERSVELLESKADASYWKTAIDEALLTDDDIIGAVSTRAARVAQVKGRDAGTKRGRFLPRVALLLREKSTCERNAPKRAAA